MAAQPKTKTTIDKKVLLFFPHYVGSLRYFEKLIPALSKKYDIKIALLSSKWKYTDELREYTQNKSYSVLDAGKPAHTGIFLLDFLFGLLMIRKSARVYLGVPRLAKIICVNDNSIEMRYILNEAANQNIEGLLLQWALTYPDQRNRPKRETTETRKKIYEIGKPIIIAAKKFLTALVLGNEFIRDKGPIGSGPSARFGVINNEAREFFIKEGVPREKISVVGNPDFSLAEEVKNKFDKDRGEMEKTAARLGIRQNKKNVVIYSSPFNSKDVSLLSDREQYEYIERIVKIIRTYLPIETHNVLFKIHPSENITLYRKLDDYGVKLFDKDSNNFDLIYFADLYIAHGSTTNFIPIIMGKEAIFINLLKLDSIEGSRGFFGIKRFIHEWDEFESLIKAYFQNNLPNQYEVDPKIITTHSIEKIVQWIG